MAFRTQRDLERLALPPGKAEVFHFDARCPGLSVRIQRHGAPTFAVWFSVGGKRKRLTLGPVAGIDLDQARRKATELVNVARDGRDPAQERRQARVKAATVYTLDDLVNDYLEQRAGRKQRASTLAETKRALHRHWAPLHALPAADVTRRAVSARLIALTASNGAVCANRARSALSSCFSWAITAGLIDDGNNPVAGTIVNDEVSRSRVLSLIELRAIWQATSEPGAYNAIIRLLMLTACRRSEVGGMRWAELNPDLALWSIPGERVKNKRPHELPLSRQALAIIAAYPQLPGRPYLFGRRGLAPFTGWSASKAHLDARIAEHQGSPLAPWVIHDVRRSFSTLCAERELIQPHLVEVVLNHAGGHREGVAQVYNRARYASPMKAALQRWADWLEAAVEPDAVIGGNVVSMGGRHDQ